MRERLCTRAVFNRLAKPRLTARSASRTVCHENTQPPCPSPGPAVTGTATHYQPLGTDHPKFSGQHSTAGHEARDANGGLLATPTTHQPELRPMHNQEVFGRPHCNTTVPVFPRHERQPPSPPQFSHTRCRHLTVRAQVWHHDATKRFSCARGRASRALVRPWPWAAGCAGTWP